MPMTPSSCLWKWLLGHGWEPAPDAGGAGPKPWEGMQVAPRQSLWQSWGHSRKADDSKCNACCSLCLLPCPAAAACAARASSPVRKRRALRSRAGAQHPRAFPAGHSSHLRARAELVGEHRLPGSAGLSLAGVLGPVNMARGCGVCPRVPVGAQALASWLLWVLRITCGWRAAEWALPAQAREIASFPLTCLLS